MDAAAVQGDGVRRDAASQGLRGRFGFGDVHDAAVQGKAVTHPDAVAATDVQRAGAAKGKAAVIRADAVITRDGENVCAAQVHRRVTVGADAGTAAGNILQHDAQPVQRHAHRRTVPIQAGVGGTAAGEDGLVGLRVLGRRAFVACIYAKQLHGAPACGARHCDGIDLAEARLIADVPRLGQCGHAQAQGHGPRHRRCGQLSCKFA